MAHRSDIRRIGHNMRQRGADGSLAAWVEAELDRVDLSAPVPGCLASLVEDLTGMERQQIVGAILDLAIAAPVIDVARLDSALAVGRELRLDEDTVDTLFRDSTGWSLRQARELAALDLPARTTPAAYDEARKQRATGFVALSDTLPDTVDFPPMGDPTESATFTERMDHLADAVKAHDAGEDIHDDDPPTVEMTPEAVQALLKRGRPAPVQDGLRPIPPQFSQLADAMQDGPPSLGLDAAHGEALAQNFDRTMDDTPELMPLDWGEADAFTVNDFTLSEQLLREAEAESKLDVGDDEPTVFTRVPNEVLEAVAKAKAAKIAEASAPKSRATKPAARSEAEKTRPVSTRIPEQTDQTDEVDMGLSPMPLTEPSSSGLTAHLALVEPGHDGPDTSEILLLDLDEAPDEAFDRILGNTGPLPRLPPVAPVDELDLDDEPSIEPELSLDPDTGDRLPVAESLRSRWTPPPTQGSPTNGITRELVALRGGLPQPDDDLLTPELQPLDEGLSNYWAPTFSHQGDGLTGELRTIEQGIEQGDDPRHGLTGELRMIEPGSLDLDEGLTLELTPVADERPRRRGPNKEGLTQDLTPLFEAPKRQRRRGASKEGLTSDLTLIVDDGDAS